MKSFKKTLRRIGFIVLIILAAVGVGFFGGIPLPKPTKKEDTIEMIVEMEESVKDDEIVSDYFNQE
ncbi:hypothetical protein JKA74_14125 [Marivirga sp. S37H4]|uniref:Uncharacterized protein n=1 Tax=Marivirga aurantiaca TaxID=2802615 RepID=A0A934WZP0_9BACT|nr:hypothetical protein [Marivirga aurantiaca]MBK6266178.1 hypothetical protein [Marivirga aurantiaca]